MANTKEPKFRKKSPVMAFLAPGNTKEEETGKATNIKTEAPAQASVTNADIDDGLTKLERRKKAVNDKRYGIYMPNEIYIKLFNESVKEDISLNALIVKIFKEHLGEG